MAINLLLNFLLFLLTTKTGFSAENSKFVQTGASVQLDLQAQQLPVFDDFSWTNDKSENIVKYFYKYKELKLHSSYPNRIEFNETSFSLTLKNMQKVDSGQYTARISGESNKDVVVYSVSVMDAVEAPVLTKNLNSNEFCTVNLTCKAQDLIINSIYQNNTCSPEGKITSRENYNLTLSLHCSEESIICNYSNPVSWKKDQIDYKQLCVKDKENKKQEAQSYLKWVAVTAAIPIIILGIIIVLVFLHHKRKTGTQDVNGTVYAQVQGQEMQKINSDAHTYDTPERLQTQTQDGMEVNNPTTTYCTVGQHQKPTNPIETTGHTIYSSVCKQPPKKQNDISSDDTEN